jgi:hypothetical protein
VVLLSTLALSFFVLGEFLKTFELTLKTIGIFLLIIGSIIFIIGLIPEGEEKTLIQPPKDRNCLNCGKAIPFEASICPYCKTDFENIKINPKKHYNNLKNISLEAESLTRFYRMLLISFVSELKILWLLRDKSI